MFDGNSRIRSSGSGGKRYLYPEREVHDDHKMKRRNGEIRDRTKVMRGLKIEKTPIRNGYQIFHSYLRPHGGLQGRTPAEAFGIQIPGDNEWITLISNASLATGS